MVVGVSVGAYSLTEGRGPLEGLQHIACGVIFRQEILPAVRIVGVGNWLGRLVVAVARRVILIDGAVVL